MPARAEEVKHARAEGVTFITLHSPVEFIGDDKGILQGCRLQKMELVEPDGSGRPRPVAIPGSEHIIPLDVAIIAAGTGANPLIHSSTPDLEVNRWGYITVDHQTMRTSMKRVFAGGDIVSGSATVILAMEAGRKAARSIHEFLNQGS